MRSNTMLATVRRLFSVALLLGGVIANAQSYRVFSCKTADTTFDVIELDKVERDIHFVDIRGKHPGLKELAAKLNLSDNEHIRIEFPRTNFTKCTFKALDEAEPLSAVFDCFFTGFDGVIIDRVGNIPVREVFADSRLHHITVNNGFDFMEHDLKIKGLYLNGSNWEEFRIRFDELKSCTADYSPF